MNIIPILKRELVVAARQRVIHIQRCALPTILLLTTLTVFVSDALQGADLSSKTLTRAAEQTLLAGLAWHCVFILYALVRSGSAIASEKDRRTLDFLLATRLSNAEIVFGKLAVVLLLLASTSCAGIPVMLILTDLVGVDRPLLFLVFFYAGVASTAVFVCGLALCVSIEAVNAAKAVGYAILLVFAWLVVPLAALVLLRATGIQLPEWVISFIGLLASSSPIAVFKALALGGATWPVLEYHLAWMIGLQTIGSCAFLAIAVKRLRSAYRTNLDGADERRRHAVWRFRPRPPVSDDPILWRAMYTSRGTGLTKALEIGLNTGVLMCLAYATWQYAAPAFVELWNHGYGTTQRADPPELNIFAIFYTNLNSLVPADFARTQFNAFIRIVSLLLVIVLSSGAGSNIEADLVSERARETWIGLLATSLAGADILRAKALAALWRLKGMAMILVGLWGLGVLAGAIHPLGVIYALVTVIAWTGFFLALVARNALRSKTMKPGPSPISALFMALPASVLLLLFLPAQFRSVLLGAGSSAFVIWLSLFSYRDIRDVSLFSAPMKAYPPLQWIGIGTGDGPWMVIFTCVLGVAIPALVGFVIWRRTVANFDRYAGRPVRSK